MKIGKKVVACLLVLAMCIAMVGCGKGKSLADQTTLVMATNAQFPPYEYYDNQTITGIDAEIAKAIADSLGMELKIEDMEFDSIITAVTAGKADLGIAGMTVTEKRQKSVDFSTPYVTACQSIIVKAEDTEIVDADSLVNRKIGVQLGTTGDIYAGDIEGATIEQYNSGFEAVQALTQGKVDAVIIDNEPAKVFAQKEAGVKILDAPFVEEEYAIAIKKGNDELLKAVNDALAELKESGKLQEIIDRYITAEE